MASACRVCGEECVPSRSLCKTHRNEDALLRKSGQPGLAGKKGRPLSRRVRTVLVEPSEVAKLRGKPLAVALRRFIRIDYDALLGSSLA